METFGRCQKIVTVVTHFETTEIWTLDITYVIVNGNFAEEFVERLAWRTATSSSTSSASLSSNPFESGGGGVRAGGSNPFGDPSPESGDNQSFDARQLNDVFIQVKTHSKVQGPLSHAAPFKSCLKDHGNALT